MNLRGLVVVAALLAPVSACKGNRGQTFEIKREVKRDSKMMTGMPGELVGSLADARPSLTITGVTGPLAEGLRRSLEASRIAARGAVEVTVSLAPASPDEDGTADATLGVTARFAHPPKISKLEGTLSVHLTYSNARPDQLGDALGDAIASWLDGEKLPANLGVPSAAVPPITQIVAGPPSCTLHEDRSVRCWDVNGTEGLLVPKAAGSIAIAASSNFGACGLFEDGRAWCLDAWDNHVAFEVREVCGITGASEISVGQSTACAILADGKVSCWPREPAAYAPCSGPSRAGVIAGIEDAIRLESGPFGGCAVKRDGTVACWDHDARKPALVKGIADARAVVYAFQPCAWVDDDKVVCAKDGNRAASSRVVPEPIKALVRGRMGVCALGTQGNLWCAHGDKPFEKDPDATGVTAISGGIGGTCSLNSKGEVACWGGLSGSDPRRAVALSH